MGAQSLAVNRRIAALLLAGVVPVAVAGCGSAGAPAATVSSGPSVHTLTVAFRFTDTAQGAYCNGGKGGYSDISSTATVTVYDAGGKVIGTAPLGSDCHQGTTPSGQYDTSFVTWTTPIGSVPDEQFYQVEIGHRAKVTFSRSQLVSSGWTANASLGS